MEPTGKVAAVVTSSDHMTADLNPESWHARAGAGPTWYRGARRAKTTGHAGGPPRRRPVQAIQQAAQKRDEYQALIDALLGKTDGSADPLAGTRLMAVPNTPVNRPPVVPGAKPRPANPMLRAGPNAAPQPPAIQPPGQPNPAAPVAPAAPQQQAPSPTIAPPTAPAPSYGAPTSQGGRLVIPERQAREMPDFYDRQAILPQLQGIQDRGAVNPAPTAAGLPGVAERGEYSDFYDRQAPLPDFFQRGEYGDAPQVGGYDDELEQATYNRGLNLMQPGHTDARNDLMRKLANRGISLDSDAYRTAQNRLDTSQGNQRENLALSSVQAARDEAARRFGSGKSLREQLFGEDTQRGAETSRDRAQLFGEETQLGDEASRRARPALWRGHGARVRVASAAAALR